VNIIGISGTKRSGKNTLGNYITGRKLKESNMIEDFNLDSNGKLLVKTKFANGDIDWGVLDLDRKDDEFSYHARTTIWPYVKCYSFAEPLKDMLIDLFGIKLESVYGNEEARIAKTNIKWGDMPGVIIYKDDLAYDEIYGNLDAYGLSDKFTFKKNDSFMSGVELMQYFATEIMRKIYDLVWVNKTIKKILLEHSEISIITDVRFENEANEIKKNGGKIIRLTRNVLGSKHESETALNNYENFDMIIDNKNMTHEEYIQYLDKNYDKIIYTMM
jgi:hypothetical protein